MLNQLRGEDIDNANIVILNKSNIESTTAGLSSDLSPNDLTLVKESNGQSINTNNSLFTLNIEGGLLNLVGASNFKNINTDIE